MGDIIAVELRSQHSFGMCECVLEMELAKHCTANTAQASLNAVLETEK